MEKRLIITLLAITAIVANSFSQIKMPALFSDNMVLQQNSEVAVWGWAGPAEKVKIVASWNSSDTIIATANNQAKWMAKIKTVKAGGPYTMTFIGTNRIELQNVMLGEVWICSGQSNMEWSVNHGIKDGETEAANATHPNLHFFQVPKIGAETPQEDCKTSWSVCTPQTMRSVSAVGYFFGRELMQKLNVPVGLIISAWGGTPAEVWIKKELIEKDSVLFNNRYDKEYDWWPGAPGITWNSMINPLVPYNIAGAIWYQGESNSSKPNHYGKLMLTLIESWRKDFGKQFPFYWVQIAPFEYGDKNQKAYLIREQETNMLAIPNTGMVVVSDLVDDIKNIHPKNKVDVGKRLAAWALNESYNIKTGEYKSPMFESAKTEDGKIKINFTNAVDGLTCTAKSPGKFLISGENQIFVPAQAKIEGNSVVVFSKTVKKPVAVRFCFDNTTLPDIFNKSGLPLAPFRTDSW